MSTALTNVNETLGELRAASAEVEDLYRSEESVMPSADASTNCDPVPSSSAGISFVDHPRPAAGGAGPFDDILSTLKSMSNDSMSKPAMVHGASMAGPGGGLPVYKEGEMSDSEAEGMAPGMGGDKARGVQMLSARGELMKPLTWPAGSDGEAGVGEIRLDNEWDNELREGDDMGSMARMQQGAANAGVFGEQDMPSMGSGSVSTVGSSRSGMSKAKKWTDPREPKRMDTFVKSNIAEKEFAAQLYKAQGNQSVRLTFDKNGAVGVAPPVQLLQRVESTVTDEAIAKSYASQSPSLGNYTATSAMTRRHSCKHCGAAKPAFVTACLACLR